MKSFLNNSQVILSRNSLKFSRGRCARGKVCSGESYTHTHTHENQGVTGLVSFSFK